tara:strand:- start:193 stop:1149 length:957 start_codon:yes stop_codon:yes gene_type:complete
MNLDFSDIKVLVVGDFMIDHYIIGESNRMSPEAPVPVVVPKEEYSIPGGAGNVAMNLKLMGADVTCVGCIGNDIWGEKLLSILKNQGINTEKIEIIDDHPTTLKQRIYSDGKQVARLDTEKIINWEIDEDTTDIAENYDVLILSDYNKGVLHNPNLFLTLIDVSQLSPDNRLESIIVDPKKDDFSHYDGVNIITPNLDELQKATKMKIDDNESILKACKKLIEEYGIEYIVAKKGDKGITIVGEDNFVKHIKPHTVENPDVTGAGDTVIAALSIAYAKTNDIEFSAKFANAAAALAVSKAGTASVTIDEINNYIEISK